MLLDRFFAERAGGKASGKPQKPAAPSSATPAPPDRARRRNSGRARA